MENGILFTNKIRAICERFFKKELKYKLLNSLLFVIKNSVFSFNPAVLVRSVFMLQLKILTHGIPAAYL
jgi:hypothetical protein